MRFEKNFHSLYVTRFHQNKVYKSQIRFYNIWQENNKYDLLPLIKIMQNWSFGVCTTFVLKYSSTVHGYMSHIIMFSYFSYYWSKLMYNKVWIKIMNKYGWYSLHEHFSCQKYFSYSFSYQIEIKTQSEKNMEKIKKLTLISC